MKKLMFTLVLFSTLSGYAFAGSGAGGIIRFVNSSDTPVSVTFSGVGCAGVYYDLTLVCQSEDSIAPGNEVTYKYNGGVTETWVNVAADQISWNTTSNPCAYGSTPDRQCYRDHATVKTKAHKTTNYIFDRI
ncbi:MAG: hypothetical protein K2P99_00425 [Burkholderiales bacterium]|nr:hypothetical protein [Burkholderiales bacterium]